MAYDTFLQGPNTILGTFRPLAIGYLDEKYMIFVIFTFLLKTQFQFRWLPTCYISNFQPISFQ